MKRKKTALNLSATSMETVRPITTVHVCARAFFQEGMEPVENNGNDKTAGILLASILVISACAILYELLISTLSSYFLGSSILQFSITIGVFLSAMGLGAYLSKFIKGRLLDTFINIEIWLALIGGLSALVLNAAYTLTHSYYVIAVSLILVLGTLIGLEIPLLTRILRSYKNLRNTIANVLSFDYLGALIASLVFPLVLLPWLGVMKTSFVVGILNLSVAVFSLWMFRKSIQKIRVKIIFSGIVLVFLTAGFIKSVEVTGFFEKFVYQDEIILTQQSPYQKIVLTKWNEDTRLYLNGNLQFSSVDEYRYHEPLVHIPMLAFAGKPEKVLLLGAGDGIAVRELLKYKPAPTITVVDLDKQVTALCSTYPMLVKLNNNSLNHSNVQVINQDAFNYLKSNSEKFDVIIIDLPDPHDAGLSKLYTVEFYNLVKQSLSVSGVMVTQATSPFFARKPYWCIHNTLRQVFSNKVYAFHATVPSFGMWGFQMAVNDSLPEQDIPEKLVKKFAAKPVAPLKFLNADNLPGLFIFDTDLQHIETGFNTLDNHVLLHYYEASWKNYNP